MNEPEKEVWKIQVSLILLMEDRAKVLKMYQELMRMGELVDAQIDTERI